MASVQELILAANAKRDESPLIGLVKSLAGGLDSYQAAKSNAIQDLVRQKAAEKAQQEIDYQREFEREYKAQQEAKAKEQSLKNTFNGLPESKTPAFPVSRMEREIVRGSKGFEIVEPKNSMTIPPSVMPYVQKGDLEGLTQAFGGYVPIEIARLATANRAQTGVQNRFETTSAAKVEEGKTRKTERMQDKYLNESKGFKEVSESYQRVLASAKDPSPAGDLALIFNYMKTLDPGSTVREGEFATAAQSGAFGDRIQAAVGKITSGERLSDEMRADFVNRSKLLYESQQSLQSQREQEFRRIGEGTGANMDKAIMKIGAPVSQPSGATWDDSKESRYQELLRKRGGK